MIFPEGKQTEPIYLTHWYRRHREHVIVKLAPHRHTTPLELVQAAVNQRTSDTREAKRGRGDAFDEYWCVFDVDAHPKIRDALELAAAKGICIALSAPCIELWLLIHFESQTAYLSREEAQRRSREHLSCEKKLTPAALDILVRNYSEARKRARELDRKHEGDGSPAPCNPSSGVWRLVDAISGNSAG